MPANTVYQGSATLLLNLGPGVPPAELFASVTVEEVMPGLLSMQRPDLPPGITSLRISTPGGLEISGLISNQSPTGVTFTI